MKASQVASGLWGKIRVGPHIKKSANLIEITDFVTSTPEKLTDGE
jgi:hypothetical protein